MTTSCLIVLCTVPSTEKAKDIAENLVAERLCACVNILDQVQSIFRWQAEIQNDPEVLMILKTTQDRYVDLEKRLNELHPYDVPEIIALPIARGTQSYLDWIQAEVSS